MTNNKDKGFTLVELLIVIVILGILATVTVFAVRGITERGQDNACEVDERTLSTAIEAFYAQEQRDPLGEDELLYGPRTDVAVVLTAGDDGVLKEAPTNFTFQAGTPAEYSATVGGPCV